MIRINLIPVRQVKKVKAGQRQLLLFVALLAVELVALFLLYSMTAGEIDEKRRTISELEVQIAALKREVGDYERLQAQRRNLIAQRDVINALSTSRIGPVWVLREMAALLSVNGRPTYDEKTYEEMVRRNPTAAFNTKWNPRRLWITQLTERNKGMSLAGKAKDYDDVAEFLKRMTISNYFTDIRLGRNDAVLDGGLRVVRFSLGAKLKYSLEDPAAAAAKPGAKPQTKNTAAGNMRRALRGPTVPKQ